MREKWSKWRTQQSSLTIKQSTRWWRMTCKRFIRYHGNWPFVWEIRRLQKKTAARRSLMFYLIYARLTYRRGIWRVLVFMWRHCDVTPHIFSFCLKSPTVRSGCEGSSRHGHQENGGWPHDIWNSKDSSNKYSLLMHCIKIKSLAIVFFEWAICFDGWIYFYSISVPSCSSKEA